MKKFLGKCYRVYVDIFGTMNLKKKSTRKKIVITRFSGDISMPDIIVQCNENLDVVDKFDHYLSYEAINRNN